MQEAIAVREREGGQILPIILSLGFLDKLTLHDYLSKKPGIASIDLKSYYIPKELISLVPKEIAQECLVLPIDKLGRLLTVGMACPLDTDTIYRLEEITGLTVKPMLCKLDDILGTIDRYYPGEIQAEEPKPPASPPPPEQAAPQTPKDDRPAETARPPEPRPLPASAMPVVPLLAEIGDRFARMDALPTFTDTVNRLRERVDHGNATAVTVAEIVRLDPAIVAKILSIANAGPYGMVGNVQDTNLAAALLGIDGVCELAMLSVIAGNQFDAPPLDYESFLQRSRFCSVAAFSLADRVDPMLRHTAQVTGLLHSVGSLALACAFPKRAAELSDDVTAFERISDETRLFGVGHPEAGALLAKEWGIPEPVEQALRLHRDLPAAASAGPLAAVTAFAAILADAFMADEPEPAHAIQEGEHLLKSLEISAKDALQTFNHVRSAMRDGPIPGN